MSPARLEDIPNIGKSIAADLRSLGILNPQQLAKREPLEVYLALSDPMGRRHDPCVLYTLMAANIICAAAKPSPGGNSPHRGKRCLRKPRSQCPAADRYFQKRNEEANNPVCGFEIYVQDMTGGQIHKENSIGQYDFTGWR